ncbi:MAG: hypothetical protein AAB486_04190 [Patescibacteria group bacterium]
MAIVLKALNCTQCGAAISSDSLKCSSCGTQFLIDWVSSSPGLRVVDAKENDLLAQLGKNRDRVVDSLMLSLFQHTFRTIGWESEPVWDPVYHQIVFKARHAADQWLDVVTIEMYPPNRVHVDVKRPKGETNDYWATTPGSVRGRLSWETGLLLGRRFYKTAMTDLPTESYRGEMDLMASPQIAALAEAVKIYCLSTLPKPAPVGTEKRRSWQSVFDFGHWVK